MKPKKFAGLGLLLSVMIVLAGFKLIGGDDPRPTPTAQPTPSVVANAITVHGIIGKGKDAFVHDPDIAGILKAKYGITVAVDKEVGSYEQVTECVKNQATIDFCWPSSENAGLQIQSQVTGGTAQSAIIFNSPIVLYTWAPIADALIQQGIVHEANGAYFVDFAKLVDLINSGTPWSSIGLPELFGGVTIYSTDPAKSNTGYSFAGLLGDTLNGGKVVDQSTVGEIAPNVQAFFNRMGYLPPTTAPFF